MGAKIRSRLEVLAAAVGLLMYWMIVQFSETALAPWVHVVVLGLAGVYLYLIMSRPMRLPEKEPQLFDWDAVIRAGRTIVPAALAAAAVNIVLSLFSQSESSNSFGWFLGYLVLLIGLGSAGLAAERSLPVDLFPVIRKRTPRWIAYVLTAALFLTLTLMFVDNLFGDLFTAIGQAFGDRELPMSAVISGFDAGSPVVLLLHLVVGAGIFEELLFRVGIMTLVWRLTRGWSWGLLVSSILFGLYHLTPFSGMEAYLAAPVSAFLNSLLAGLVTGLVYRWRGFTAAVLMHSLGNWIVILLFSGVFG